MQIAMNIHTIIFYRTDKFHAPQLYGLWEECESQCCRKDTPGKSNATGKISSSCITVVNNKMIGYMGLYGH